MDNDKFTIQRKQMVISQLQARDIVDHRILEAFRKVPRHRFIAEKVQGSAYRDYPLPIACGQTISQPYMVALMTQCLELQGNEKVLEIGTGSGYQTAILAELAKEVYSVERYSELTERATRVLEDLDYHNVSLINNDGTLGWPVAASYQGIVVTAGAPQIPQALKDQLDEGGRLVIPVGDSSVQKLLLIRKYRDSFIEKEICDCVFVPLIGQDGWFE